MTASGLGLVLSGGGARAIAHIGVLQALEEIGLRPAVISGVSAGALVGALYAAGHSPEQILSVVKQEGSFSLSRFFRYPGGLFSSDNLRRIISASLAGDDFAALSIPLIVTATDIKTGTALHVSAGRLTDVLIGSCAIPSVFQPVPYNGHLLVDGGVLDNLPAAVMKGKCRYVIGSHVNNLGIGSQPAGLNRLEVLERCFHLAIGAGVRQQARLCDVFIEPPMSGYSMFDLRPADALFQAGYQATMAHRRELTRLQEPFTLNQSNNE